MRACDARLSRQKNVFADAAYLRTGASETTPTRHRKAHAPLSRGLSPSVLYFQCIVPMQPIDPAYSRTLWRCFRSPRATNSWGLIHHIEFYVRLSNAPNVRQALLGCQFYQFQYTNRRYLIASVKDKPGHPVRTRRRLMQCRSCGSERQAQFDAEINIHFPGKTGMDKPAVVVSPNLLVCLDCGFAECNVAETTLPRLAESAKT
jgi:hypothetical protein